MQPLDDESPTVPSIPRLPGLPNLTERPGFPNSRARQATGAPLMPGRQAASDAPHAALGMDLGAGEDDHAPGASLGAAARLGSQPTRPLTRPLTGPLEPEQRRPRRRLIAALALAVVLLCVLALGIASLLPGYANQLSGSLTQAGTSASRGTGATSGTPQATAGSTVPGGAGGGGIAPTPGPGTPVTTTTPGADATTTVTGGSGGAIPTATDIGAPTATPAPQLSVSPLTASGNCVLGSWPKLTVRNTGGGRLSWSATTSDKTFVKASPSSSTLDAGAQVTVTLSGALHLGNQLKVTFSSNGGSAMAIISCR